MNEKMKRARMLRITYDDGSTEDFDTFIVAIAEGLIPVGQEDGEVLYTAGEEFATRGIAHVLGTPDVAVGLIESIIKTVGNVTKNMPPEVAPGFLKALLNMDHEGTEVYHESRSVKLRGEDG